MDSNNKYTLILVPKSARQCHYSPSMYQKTSKIFMNVSSISNFMDQQTKYTFDIKLVGESRGVPGAATSQCSRTTQNLKALGI